MCVVRTPQGGIDVPVSHGAVPLIEPPQGGQVVFVGVRARHLDGCGLDLTASLREVGSDKVLAFDRRAVDLALGADAWGVPPRPAEISGFANVPACPIAALSTNVQDQPHMIDVRVRDRTGRTAGATLDVVPVCSEPSLAGLCACECSQGGLRSAVCGPSR
jgi:hypothetical protein